VTVLIVARILAPSLILTQVNKKLRTMSPTYSLQIEDMDLSIIRGAYQFENLTGQLKGSGVRFLTVEQIDVSVAWREIFRGRILTDVVVNTANFTLTKDLIEGSKAAKPADDAKDASATLFPVRVARIELRDSSFAFAELMKDSENKKWRISSIDGSIVNFTPIETSPNTLFTLKGTMLESSVFKMAGKALRLNKPEAWDVDGEIREFDLVAANPMLLKLVPFTFTSGKLDMYVEAKSENGQVKGYLKPFLKKVDVVANKEKFEGVKHFFVEIFAALGNLILRKSDDKSTAFVVPFRTAGGKLKVDTGNILPTAIEHGFNGGLDPGIEDRIDIKDKPSKDKIDSKGNKK